MVKSCLLMLPLALSAVLPAQTLRFSYPKQYLSAPGARAIAVGDFDGDGVPDLVVTDSNSTRAAGTLSVLLGRGDGTFNPPVNQALGIEPFAVATGDFDGDGKTDIAVANYMSSTITIMLSNGTGVVTPSRTYSLSGALPNWITVADVNGDGNLDLVVANYYGANGPGSIAILLGNGDGTFQSPVTYNTGGNAFAVVVGDFNGDGKLDLAATNNNYVTGQVWILLGNGDGTFQPPVAHNLPAGPTAIVAADFNGDGKPDLAVGLFDGLAVLLGNGDGTFQAPAVYGNGNVFSLAVSDLNRDGKADIAASYSHGDGFITVFEGHGDGTFAGGADFQSGNREQHSLVAASLRNNGRSDLVIANTRGKTVSVLLNRTR